MIRILALALAGVSSAASAQTACRDRAVIVDKLVADYGESFSGGGMQSETSIVEVWTSEAGTWTVLRTFANGKSCVIASGIAWRKGPPPGDPA